METEDFSPQVEKSWSPQHLRKQGFSRKPAECSETAAASDPLPAGSARVMVTRYQQGTTATPTCAPAPERLVPT